MYYFGNVLALPPVPTIICTLAVGAMLGAVNGVIQVLSGLPSFIITLATSLVYRGVLTMNTSGFPVVVKFPASYAQAIAGKILFGYRISCFGSSSQQFSQPSSCCAPAWEIGPSRSVRTRQRPATLAFPSRERPSPCSRFPIHLGSRGRCRRRAIFFDRRQSRNRLGADRHRHGGDRRHPADGRIWKRHWHGPRRAHVRHGQRRPVAGGSARLLGQYIPRRRRARRSADKSARDYAICHASGPDRAGTSSPPAVGAPKAVEGPAIASPAVGNPVVALRHVTMTFQSVTALRDIPIEAHAGRVLALLGDNGAGKSTLIKVLSASTDRH